MGVSQSQGTKQLLQEELADIFVLPYGVWLISSGQFAPDALVGLRFLSEQQRKQARCELDHGVSKECDRAVGCLLGLLVGDALGAPLEFHPVRYTWDPQCPRTGRDPRAGFDKDLWKDQSEMRETNRFLLSKGQWTDDGSMALCLADSLLAHNGFHPRDLRLRFLAWWMLGYNNAFRLDQEQRLAVWGSSASIGLGGIIGESMQEFVRVPADYTKQGNLHSSGNGSIMRNAPVPIMYHHDVDIAMEVAWRQSKTTHQGDEAADCARLLTWVCVNAIKSGAGRTVLNDISAFPARLYATRCLAAAMQEERHVENSGMDLADRNWSWRSSDFRYSQSRSLENPGYAGSYCMDCLAMALHCVYATKTFEAAVLRAADLCGDADTVAAVTGQLAGAMYGAIAIPASWSHEVEQWDEGDARCRAVLLFMSDKPSLPATNERPDGKSWTELPKTSDEFGVCTDALVEASPMPFACECGKRLASQKLLDMHLQRCSGRKRDSQGQMKAADVLFHSR